MKIRTRKNPTGKLSFQLDLGVVNGRRIRKTFQFKADAQAALVAARAQSLAFGIASLAPKTPEHPSLNKWLAKLNDTGKTLDDVFLWFFKTFKEQPPCPPPERLIAEYQSELRRLNRTRQHTNESVTIVSNLFACVPRLETINRNTVLPFVTQNGYSARSQQKRLVIIKAFLEWCVASHYLETNPLSGSANRIRIAKVESKEILTLGAPEAKTLLRVAAQPAHRSLLGWLTLALFAGVRPQEIARSHPQALNLEEGIFRVIAKASKTSQTRVIELHPTAIAWLKYWQQTAGANAHFVSKGHRERWDRLRQEAGLAENWVHDVLRHTFASMHYAAFQNASQLRALMGHSQNENTLFSHYRAVQTISGATLTKTMAEEFWEMSPQRIQPTH
jgi:integrase